jgi:hypothetical protein
MKKILFFTVIGLSLILTNNIHAQIKKAAIISIYGNKNLSDDPLDTKLYEVLLNDSSFDISGTVADFEKVIMDKMIPNFSFSFMEKSEVISNLEYQKVESKFVENDVEGEKFTNYLNPYVPAEGYRNLAAFGPATDKKAIQKCFEIFPDVDAVLIAYINYNIYDAKGAMGISSKKVYAYCNIKVFNNEGKRIFKLTERASSNKGVMAVGGFVLDPAKLKPMISSSSENLLKEMEGKIAKSMAKMAKKLAK